MVIWWLIKWGCFLLHASHDASTISINNSFRIWGSRPYLWRYSWCDVVTPWSWCLHKLFGILLYFSSSSQDPSSSYDWSSCSLSSNRLGSRRASSVFPLFPDMNLLPLLRNPPSSSSSVLPRNISTHHFPFYWEVVCGITFFLGMQLNYKIPFS